LELLGYSIDNEDKKQKLLSISMQDSLVHKVSVLLETYRNNPKLIGAVQFLRSKLDGVLPSIPALPNPLDILLKEDGSSDDSDIEN
jgi:hypothetical protein